MHRISFSYRLPNASRLGQPEKAPERARAGIEESSLPVGSKGTEGYSCKINFIARNNCSSQAPKVPNEALVKASCPLPECFLDRRAYICFHQKWMPSPINYLGE